MNAYADRPARSRWPRRLLVIVIAVAVVAWAVLPSLALDFFVRHGLAGSGWELRASSAKVGPFLDSLTIKGLAARRLNGGPAFSSSVIKIEGFSVYRLYRLYKDGFQGPAVKLAGHLSIENMALNLPQGPDVLNLSAALLEIDDLATDGPAWTGLPPLGLSRLSLKNFTAARGGLPLAEAGELALRDLKPQSLGAFLASKLSLNGPELSASLDSLALADLDLDLTARILEGREPAMLPLWLLQCADRLDLANFAASRKGRDFMRLGSAVFDRNEAPDGTVNYSRTFDFFADAQPLGWLLDPESLKLWKTLTGGQTLSGRLDLTAAFNPGRKSFDLTRAELWAPGQGRLSLSGRLEGVTAVKPGLSPSQFLFSAASWSLASAALDFRDDSFMSRFYPYLGKNFVTAPAKAGVGERLATLMTPLFRRLDESALFKNSAAFEAEIKAFLKDPKRLRLEARPGSPVPLMGLYTRVFDSLALLNLSIEAGGRPAVSLGAAEGVRQDRLPSRVPQPMDSLFQEEDLPE